MEEFPIIDADGHVTESNRESQKTLEDREYRNRPLMTFGGLGPILRRHSGQAQ